MYVPPVLESVSSTHNQQDRRVGARFADFFNLFSISMQDFQKKLKISCEVIIRWHILSSNFTGWIWFCSDWAHPIRSSDWPSQGFQRVKVEINHFGGELILVAEGRNDWQSGHQKWILQFFFTDKRVKSTKMADNMIWHDMTKYAKYTWTKMIEKKNSKKIGNLLNINIM